MTDKPVFDLTYVSGSEGRTMSCGILHPDGTTELIGPFPADQSGPAIVAELLARPGFEFADKKAAEVSYTMTHFRNMSRGENDAGLAYPFKA